MFFYLVAYHSKCHDMRICIVAYFHQNMITFQTYNEIRFLHDHKGLSYAKIAGQLNLCSRTVGKWAVQEIYKPRKTPKRSSILDPYKPAIRRDWELGGCNFAFIFDRLRQAGYTGSKTIIRTYLSSLRRKKPYHDNQLLLPFEWMLRLIQGKLAANIVREELGILAPPEDVAVLLKRVCDGPLRVRNKSITILAHLRNIPQHEIARFLIIDRRVVGQYIQNYRSGGIAKLFAFREGRQKKHEQEEYKSVVFELLHSPPKVHGINRTTWRMDDLKMMLRHQGIVINEDSIRKIIRNAGYKFRSAKRVLTSTDPEYQEKLAELTRTLSGLTELKKFFSIDEFGPFAVKIQGGRALTAPGENRVVPQWQKSKGSLTLVGALELSTNQVTHFYATRKSTAEMIKLMHILLDQYCHMSQLYLSWDAASWHASKAFLAEVARLNEEGYRAHHHTPSIVLVPLPASAQFLNVIESVFSGMARAIIHNSDYASVEECQAAIDIYFVERNDFFQKHPKRAGNKIWGKERVAPIFSPSNNCKDPKYR